MCLGVSCGGSNSWATDGVAKRIVTRGFRPGSPLGNSFSSGRQIGPNAVEPGIGHVRGGLERSGAEFGPLRPNKSSNFPRAHAQEAAKIVPESPTFGQDWYGFGQGPVSARFVAWTAEQAFRASSARLVACWRWAARPAEPWCGGVVGLQDWRKHVILRRERPQGEGSARCCVGSCTGDGSPPLHAGGPVPGAPLVGAPGGGYDAALAAALAWVRAVVSRVYFARARRHAQGVASSCGSTRAKGKSVSLISFCAGILQSDAGVAPQPL